ncbi:MAG: S-formylglutathione hydrolase, partial [Pseudomonadales bacterium]
MSNSLTLQSEALVFGGRQLKYTHDSDACACTMQFSIFLPPAAENQAVPVLYWLSGLTCTDENFVAKAGAQRYAAAHGLAIVMPDTSPRGDDVPDDDAWDFGTGAGFYLNATQMPWAKNYNMYDYVVSELPALVNSSFSVDADRCSISGHSMGGHGAIVIGLRNADTYRSISAFAPITAPTQCPWGQQAFGRYLGEDASAWQAYDSCELVRKYPSKTPLLVDQGGADGFLTEQLKPELLQKACQESACPLVYNLRPGYDHSYFFISTFIGEHIQH